MSITNALSNALTGLSAVSRAADVVSNNVSNAMTDGYGRRDIELSSRTLGRNGAGVEVVGVSRHYDPVVTGNRRLADASVGMEGTLASFQENFARALGQADEPQSLTGRITGLETALIEAASQPHSDARLSAVLNAAKGITDSLNSAADAIVTERVQADSSIGKSVEFLQSALEKVVEINVSIQESSTIGYDVNSLLDQRQGIIDQISELVPVKEIPRKNGMVALMTTGGAMLVDSKAATLEFTTTPTISPDMTIENGPLSGLTLNGQPVSTDMESGFMAGGKLAALFHVRDVAAPQAQVELDAVARDVIERFQSPAVDATLGLTDAGLFTDATSYFDSANEENIAARISVNSAVDPSKGGDLWKLRDGIGALAEGDPGNASTLRSLADALRAPRSPVSGGFSSHERSSVSLSSDLYSLVSTRLLDSESAQSFASARQETFRSMELEQGVDTDQEMQKLLLIEQNYSANARVIETIDKLIDQLLGMT
ncbi:flagellar hook-associated protein FlgK [Celeribacter arenosi]|uniref:Flagellar hook-associated protein 1 n=1 Tax=Celeribacter arenosi TaxID=792649 RepID=A0ABP7JXQ2_9RHOB